MNNDDFMHVLQGKYKKDFKKAMEVFSEFSNTMDEYRDLPLKSHHRFILQCELDNRLRDVFWTYEEFMLEYEVELMMKAIEKSHRNT